MRKVIVNSTPLIALCHINKLDILKQLYGEVIIPSAVYKEISAKKHAKYLGLPVTGTLGVLIKAKQKGLIPELKPLLNILVDKHIYISDSLINMCLKQVNEE